MYIHSIHGGDLLQSLVCAPEHDCGNRTVAAAVLEHKFDMIFFTGPTYVGKIAAAAAAKNLTAAIFELDGKSPCIVDLQPILPSPLGGL